MATEMRMTLDSELLSISNKSKDSSCIKRWKSLKESILNGSLLDRQNILYNANSSSQQDIVSTGQSKLENDSILLHAGGAELSDLLKSKAKLLASIDTTKIEDELLNLLVLVEEISLPLVFLLYERHKFFSRTQSEEEPICEFVNDIKVMAKYCDFQEKEDHNIASKIRSGLFQESVRQNLQVVNDSDLKMLPVCKVLNGPGSPVNKKCHLHTFVSQDSEDSSVGAKPFIVTIVTQSKKKGTKTRSQPPQAKKKVRNVCQPSSVEDSSLVNVEVYADSDPFNSVVGFTTEEERMEHEQHTDSEDKIELNEKKSAAEHNSKSVMECNDRTDPSTSALGLTTVEDRMEQSTHEGIKLPIKSLCHFCGQSVECASKFNCHIMKHTEERLYACMQKGDLEGHAIIPVPTSVRRNCVRCYRLEGKERKASIKCEKCSKFFCFKQERNCLLLSHP